MKALTVKQPWAYLLCSGIKDIENRSWKLPEKYKGKIVLIHASTERKLNLTSLTREQYECACEIFTSIGGVTMNPVDKWDRSAIIGSVEFVDCTINHPSIWAERSLPGQCEHTYEWFKPTYNWVVANPILFDKPILNVKGKLSFWEYENIKTGVDEGKEVCLCNLPVKEEEQVINMLDSFRCRYCGGVWYK